MEFNGFGFSSMRVPTPLSYKETDFALTRTNKAHLTGVNEKLSSGNTKPSNFSDLLLKSIDNTSTLDNQAKELAVQSVIHPDSVEAHDVNIASAKATMALNITQSIVSRALEAYRLIISMR